LINLICVFLDFGEYFADRCGERVHEDGGANMVMGDLSLTKTSQSGHERALDNGLQVTLITTSSADSQGDVHAHRAAYGPRIDRSPQRSAKYSPKSRKRK